MRTEDYYNREQRFWLRLWAIAAITLVSILITIFIYDYHKDAQYLAKGYQKTAIMGPVGFRWQKAKE